MHTIRAEDKLCTYGKEDSCPKDSYCIKYEKNKDVCWNMFQQPLKTILYPFKPDVSSYCDQGPLSPPGNSHTWNNTAFAVDIKSYSTKNVAIIAGVDGTVITFNECKTENDQCGLGFGNQVKILTEDNFIVFYAHLKELKVKTGDVIRAGTIIGTEGITGWTGKENKHLHLSVHYDWKTTGLEYWKNAGYLPASVPFQIESCEGTISVHDLKCKRGSSSPSVFCFKTK